MSMTCETSKTSLNHSLLSGRELLSGVDGGIIGKFDADRLCFTSVATDSRNVVAGTLFVPLIGENQDGHRFIPGALEGGATVVFVTKSVYEANRELYEALSEKWPDVAFISVAHNMYALQAAAESYVKKFPNLIKCAVTGSSGKTTTKEIAVALLGQKYEVVSNKGNLNSETGLPLSVFQIRDEHTLALFEMGMNRVNEIGEIAKVLKPNYGIVTNIGTAHIGILGSREAIASEKKKVFTYLNENGVAVIPASDDFASFLAEGVPGKIVNYGFEKGSALEGECDVLPAGVRFISDDGVDGTTFSVDGVKMTLALPGIYNFSNALGAIALARELGVSAEQIKAGIESVTALGARSHIIKGTYTLLEDCYNANPDSMEKALDFCASVRVQKRKIFVLGDMLELGAESEVAHAAMGAKAAQAGASLVVFVGKEMKAAYEEAQKLCGDDCRLIYNEAYTDEAIERIASDVKGFASEGDFIFLKGSNGIGLKRLVPLLSGEQD